MYSADSVDKYQTRQSIIEALDVTATLVVDGDNRITYLKCQIVETSLQINDNPTPDLALPAV